MTARKAELAARAFAYCFVGGVFIALGLVNARVIAEDVLTGLDQAWDDSLDRSLT